MRVAKKVRDKPWQKVEDWVSCEKENVASVTTIVE